MDGGDAREGSDMPARLIKRKERRRAKLEILQRQDANAASKTAVSDARAGAAAAVEAAWSWQLFLL